MQPTKFIAHFSACFICATFLLPTQACAKKNENTATENIAAGNIADSLEEDKNAPSFQKIYSLPIPLPTARKITKHSIKSIRESRKRQRAEKKFPKHYALAKTFAIPSIEASKSIEATEKFQKIAQIPDPFVKFNRTQFKSGHWIEKNFFRPLAKGWRKIPKIITAPIANFSRNLARPKDFVNAVLQGNPLRAIQTLFSFLLDSTIGFGGTINIAQGIGIPDTPEDFGQTLAIYGVKSGPFLISLIGPSSPRDLTGKVVDILVIDKYTNPAQYLIPYYGQGIFLAVEFVKGIDAHAKVVDQIEALELGSIDLYITTRRFYAYSRALKILNAQHPQINQKSTRQQTKKTQAQNTDPNLGIDPTDPFADIEEDNK